MDTITAYLQLVKGCLETLQDNIDAITTTTSDLLHYVYTLDVSLPDASPQPQPDGTTITKNGLVFTISHITNLTSATFQVSDINGLVMSEDVDIKVNQGSPTTVSVTLPVILPDNLQLVITNSAPSA